MLLYLKATCFGLDTDHHQAKNTIAKRQVKMQCA